MRPALIGFQQGVGCDNELSHDGGDGDLGGLSGGDELLVLGLEVGVISSGDEGRHVKGLSYVGASSSDEALTFPLTGLPRDWGEAGERCSLLVLEGSEFGHGGDELKTRKNRVL